MTRHKKLGFTTRYVLIIGLLLLAVNVVLGIANLSQSTASIRALINKDMLNVVNTAAGLMDGDALGALTEEDVGSEAYNGIMDKLSVFLDKSDIHFIYAVRQVGDGKFVFTVDPDPEDPAAFGEEIVVSRGLIRAGQGVAAVDDEAIADKWGNYYSAYSPVFDSAGNVAGVIGVDFDAEWYERQVQTNTFFIALSSIVSVLVGALVVFLITYRVRRKFQEIGVGLSSLSISVDKLMKAVAGSGYSSKRGGAPTEFDDEFDELNFKLRDLQDDMVLYLDYLQTQAYVDALTKVRSASAYHELLHELDKQIQDGGARFVVAVFDINSLKQINDRFGHEYGDYIIQNAGIVLSKTFGANNVYRIGGDEFTVISRELDEQAMRERMASLEAEIDDVNARASNEGVKLAISKGMAVYREGEDKRFADVFARADKQMYEDKKAYYEIAGNSRRQ